MTCEVWWIIVTISDMWCEPPGIWSSYRWTKLQDQTSSGSTAGSCRAATKACDMNSNVHDVAKSRRQIEDTVEIRPHGRPREVKHVRPIPAHLQVDYRVLVVSLGSCCIICLAEIEVMEYPGDRIYREYKWILVTINDMWSLVNNSDNKWHVKFSE